MATKSEFLEAYRAEVIATYPWARVNTEKLENFMHAARATIEGPNTMWAWDGAAVHRVWKQLGMTGKLTLKSLRALEG